MFSSLDTYPVGQHRGLNRIAVRFKLYNMLLNKYLHG